VYLQRETNPDLNAVTAYGKDYIQVNETKYTEPIYFSPTGEIKPLGLRNAKDLDQAQLRMLAGVQVKEQSPLDFLNDAQPSLENPQQTEIILLGTGNTQIFLDPALTAELQGIGIGVEVMTTPAAARTYNILMSEGRLVVAALII